MTSRRSPLHVPHERRRSVLRAGCCISSIVVLLVLACGRPSTSSGQEIPPLPAPADLGLVLPRGARARLTDRFPVLLRSEQKPLEPLVAETYLDVGDRYIVKLPGGELRSVRKSSTMATSRPFTPATQAELRKELLHQFKGFKAHVAEHYLCIYNTTDGFCRRKTQILESIHPLLMLFCEQQQLQPRPPRTPLVAVMFKTREEFQAFRKVPEQTLAYYSVVSNRIYLYEHSRLADVAPMLAIKQSTSTIAHEGVHQMLHNVGVQRRLAKWPMWISEGIPDYFAGASGGSAARQGIAPPNHLRMHGLFSYLDSRPATNDGSLIREVVSADQLNATQYAIAWALIHYLAAERPTDLSTYLQRLQQIPPLETVDHPLTQFATHFGHDFAAIEASMLQHVRGLPYIDPIANQPHYVVTAYTLGGAIALVTSSREQFKSSREQLLQQIPASEHPRVRFTTRIYPNKARAEAALRALKNAR